MEQSEQASDRPAKDKPAESFMIPKHRFDCVNLCLKETKEALRALTAEAAADKLKISELEKALFRARVDAVLAVQDALNKSITNYIKKADKEK